MKRILFGCFLLLIAGLAHALSPAWRVLSYRLGLLLVPAIVGAAVIGTELPSKRNTEPEEPKKEQTQAYVQPGYEEYAYEQNRMVQIRRGNYEYPTWEEHKRKEEEQRKYDNMCPLP